MIIKGEIMSKGLFVSGTGTDIGKTYVTGLILKYIMDNGYNATYFKAALSGAIKDNDGKLIPGDAVEVLSMAGLDEDTDFFIKENEDGENAVYVMKDGKEECVDDRGDLFVALRNVAVCMFPNVLFRSASYIYGN